MTGRLFAASGVEHIGEEGNTLEERCNIGKKTAKNGSVFSQ